MEQVHSQGASNLHPYSKLTLGKSVKFSEPPLLQVQNGIISAQGSSKEENETV